MKAIMMVQNINTETNSEIIKLLFQYISRRIKTQHILSILVLLTFGLGDALTGAMMMEKRGISGEANFFIARIYSENGLIGLLAAKIIFTIVLVFAAFIIYWRSDGKSYWMVNGYLISLIIFGIMATIANIQATVGLPFMSPSKIIFIFFGLIFLLVEAGDMVDNHIAQTRMMEASIHRYPWQDQINTTK